MRWQLGCAMALMGSVSATAAAGSLFPDSWQNPLDGGGESKWTRVGMLSGGLGWNSPGQTQTLYVTRNVRNTYVATKTSQVLGNGELFLAGQRTLRSNIFTQLGVDLALTSNSLLTGDIWEQANSVHNDETYAYRLYHGYVGLKTKFLMDLKTDIMPYISGSLGVGFNQSHQYTITPSNVVKSIYTQYPFQSYTSTEFSYTGGVGLQQWVTEHWQLGMGYDFANWGQSHLKPASAQTTNSALGLTHLYVHSLLFNVTRVG